MRPSYNTLHNQSKENNLYQRWIWYFYFSSYLSQQINEMKEMIKEADEKKKIAAFDASKVFPGFS